MNGTVLAVSYTGGDGNDVVLTFQSLPVELMSFTVKPIDNKVIQLDWQTASELNNTGFEIERSGNGVDFENIAFVEGNGTTFEISNYNFIDETPLNGVNYYRLKQLDFDGQFEYSKIEEVAIQQSNHSIINIYPNPVRDNLTIENGQGILTIYNMLGQLVLEMTNNESQITINVSDLPKGHYLLRITKTKGTIVTQQFVK